MTASVTWMASHAFEVSALDLPRISNQVTCLDQVQFDSVRTAAEKLSTGSIACDNNMCLVYSKRKDNWWLLYRSDQKDTAYALLRQGKSTDQQHISLSVLNLGGEPVWGPGPLAASTSVRTLRTFVENAVGLPAELSLHDKVLDVKSTLKTSGVTDNTALTCIYPPLVRISITVKNATGEFLDAECQVIVPGTEEKIRTGTARYCWLDPVWNFTKSVLYDPRGDPIVFQIYAKGIPGFNTHLAGSASLDLTAATGSDLLNFDGSIPIEFEGNNKGNLNVLVKRCDQS